jgi:predicted N-acetyltransferase YhbS
MKVFKNLLLFPKYDDEQTLERLKKMGYDGVEVPLFSGDDDYYEKFGGNSAEWSSR